MSRTALTLLCALAMTACTPTAEEEFEVPRPASADMDAAVREQLESRAGELEVWLAGEELSSRDSAAAIGELGRLFHAYDLTSDAAACYREAERRDPEGDWSYYLGFLQQVGGDLEAAAASFGRALATRPDDPAARQRLADSLAGLGRHDEAAKLYAGLLDLETSAAAAAHRGLGTLDAQAGRHREAIDHFERALTRQPGATSIHYQLAQAYRALGRENDALRHSELAGTGQVGFPDPRVAALDRLAVGAGVRLARGGVALAEGRLDLALEEYEAAVAADPGNATARTNLALVLARAGRVAEAKQQLAEALRLDGEDPTARLTLAGLLLAEGDARAAKADFEAVLVRQPEHAGALRGRADAHLALGDQAAALADLRALTAVSPEDGAARLELGTLLQESGDLEGAAVEYRRALHLELEPTGVGAAHLGMANLSAAAGDYSSALEHYDAALGAAPDLAPAAHNRAGVLAHVGRHAEAAAAYRRVLEISPERTAARFFLGDALLRSGQPAEALAAFRRVVADEPDHERARLGVAVSLKRLGRRADALAILEESMRELPRSGALAHELALTLASSPERSLRDGARATDLAAQLFEAQPSAAIAETLAMALAESGRFEEAIEIQRRLVAELGRGGDPALSARLEATLRLYEGGEACCPPPS